MLSIHVCASILGNKTSRFLRQGTLALANPLFIDLKKNSSYQLNLSRFSFYFPPPDGAASCTINETFKVLSYTIYITLLNYVYFVLKGDRMIGHHLGPYQIHPYISSCLSLSANDQVVTTFSEQKFKNVYSIVHALGVVSASTIPSDGNGWY